MRWEATGHDGENTGTSARASAAVLSPLSTSSDEDALAEDEPGNEEGLAIVMAQTGESRAQAARALRQADGDVVNAIMALTM